jgi:four helix bundle protein
MNSHKDLDVWKRAIEFVRKVYGLTSSFPKEEMYGLTNQVRRAAVSIPFNIAEGAARATKREFRQFLYISLGSLSEAETQLIIANKLGMLSITDFDSCGTDVVATRKMLLGLIRSISK